MLDHGGKREDFQGIADGIDLVHIINGEGAHHHAPAKHIFHQPIPLQLAQGLPQRRTADVESLGIIRFYNALAGGNFPVMMACLSTS